MAVKNVVLVHGAFADGSSWSTKRTIGAQDGPVLLVGHSYGGVVITEAGSDPKLGEDSARARLGDMLGAMATASLAPTTAHLSLDDTPGQWRRENAMRTRP